MSSVHHRHRTSIRSLDGPARGRNHDYHDDGASITSSIRTSTTISRRQIVRACKARGWKIQPDALELIERYLSNTMAVDDSHHGTSGILNLNDALNGIAKKIEESSSMMNGGGMMMITAILWKDVLEEDENGFDEVHEDSRDIHHDKSLQRSKRTYTQGNVNDKQGKSNRIKNSIISTTRNKNTMTTRCRDDDDIDDIDRGGGSSSHVLYDDDDLEIVDAFDTPRLVYEGTRKQFIIQQPPNQQRRWTLFGSANDKIDMFAQRYTLIHQRLLRHECFRQNDLVMMMNRQRSRRRSGATGGASSQIAEKHHKITQIESLLGQERRHNNNTGRAGAGNEVLLLGMLIQIDQDEYHLEDMTGQVPVQFVLNHDNSSGTGTNSSIDESYITEHCILLVEGIYDDGIFYINQIEQPMYETRQQSIRTIQQQVSHKAYNTTPANYNNQNYGSSFRYEQERYGQRSFIILSDVYLDRPNVLKQLEGMFAKYNRTSHAILPMFIFMGHFSSSSSGYHHSTTSSTGRTNSNNNESSNKRGGGSIGIIEELLLLISKFDHLARYGHFLIVPGPNDSNIAGSAATAAGTIRHLPSILPIPPLLNNIDTSTSNKGISKRSSNNGYGITNLYFGSNPCRVYWFDNGDSLNDYSNHKLSSSSSCGSRREMVVFRHDLLHMYQKEQLQLLPRSTTPLASTLSTPATTNKHASRTRESRHANVYDNNNNGFASDEDSDHEDMDHQLLSTTKTQPHRRMVRTIIQQNHLLPMSGSSIPLYWNYDHSLRLYPLPDIIALGGDSSSSTSSSSSSYHEVYGGCHVINPGSMTRDAQYAIYTPNKHCQKSKEHTNDNNEMDIDDSGSGSDSDDNDNDNVARTISKQHRQQQSSSSSNNKNDAQFIQF